MPTILELDDQSNLSARIDLSFERVHAAVERRNLDARGPTASESRNVELAHRRWLAGAFDVCSVRDVRCRSATTLTAVR